VRWKTVQPRYRPEPLQWRRGWDSNFGDRNFRSTERENINFNLETRVGETQTCDETELQTMNRLEAERRNVEMDEEFNNSSMFRNERNERSEMNDMNEINTRKMLLKSNLKGPCTENQRVMPEYSQSFDRGRNEHNVARQIDEPENNAGGRIISFANHSLSEPRCSTRSVDVHVALSNLQTSVIQTQTSVSGNTREMNVQRNQFSLGEWDLPRITHAGLQSLPNSVVVPSDYTRRRDLMTNQSLFPSVMTTSLENRSRDTRRSHWNTDYVPPPVTRWSTLERHGAQLYNPESRIPAPANYAETSWINPQRYNPPIYGDITKVSVATQTAPQIVYVNSDTSSQPPTRQTNPLRPVSMSRDHQSERQRSHIKLGSFSGDTALHLLIRSVEKMSQEEVQGGCTYGKSPQYYVLKSIERILKDPRLPPNFFEGCDQKS